jgi:MFS family permease
MGSVADAKGFRNTFLAGLVAFAVAYGMFSRDLALPGLVIAFVIYAVFSSANETVVKAWLSTQLPRERLGTGLGVANTVISLSFLVSSILTGVLWQSFSSGTALSVLSIGMVLPIVYILWFIPTHEPQEQ